MYRWKVTAFFVFSSLFWTVSMGSAGLTWFLLNWALNSQKTVKREQEEVKKEPSDLVKDEPEDNGSSSGSVKKEEPESSSLQSCPPERDDSGLGSGIESAEARGVQRRRSHLAEQGH